MTKDESISISRLAAKVDQMANDAVTKDLLRSEIGRIDTALNSHIKYTQDAAKAETARINEILETNAEASRQANNEANARNVAADTQAERVANTLRELVETTRSAASRSLSEVINPIQSQLNEIQQKQYENKGKEAVSDPMITTMIEEIKTLTKTITLNNGKGIGANALWGYIVGGAGFLAVILKVMGVY